MATTTARGGIRRVPADAFGWSGTSTGVRRADVGGTALAYREEGAGEPVVFVHGSVSDLRTWRHQLPALATSHRAVAYSLRYARPNTDVHRDRDNQTLAHVEDLLAFLRAIDAAPAHLVGSSWGAVIALVTAMRHPDAVRSLVLEEPPVLSLFVSDPPSPAELLALLSQHPRTALAVLGFGARTIEPTRKAFRGGDGERALRTFGIGVLGREHYEALPEARRQQMRENGAALRAQLLGAGFPPLAAEDVRTVRVPALLVTGQQTPAIFARLTDRLHELLPDAVRIDIPHASHLAHEERPDAFNHAVLDFLTTATRHGRLG